jgi:hypothetical protein
MLIGMNGDEQTKLNEWTLTDIRRNYDGQNWTNDDGQTWMVMTTNLDGDCDGQWRQQCCRVIRVRKFCNNGMQKKRNKFFSSTSCFYFILFSYSLLQQIL